MNQSLVYTLSFGYFANDQNKKTIGTQKRYLGVASVVFDPTRCKGTGNGVGQSRWLGISDSRASSRLDSEIFFSTANKDSSFRSEKDLRTV